VSSLSRLEIIPLGGLGEFGMNLMVYRCGGECILVDAGMMFPGPEFPGVDVVVPDLSFLDDCGSIHGLVLTHGHEDHIGALSYLLARHDLTVHGTEHTLRLVRHRLLEHEMLDGRRLEPLPERGALRLGPFEIETVTAAHSIPQARMIVIRTPIGIVVHTADFKLDPDPVDGVKTDEGRLADLGREGVLAICSDSTNADRAGVTPGERGVGVELGRIVSERKGRVVVSIFASHVHRLQQLVELAEATGRKLALVGASIRTHTEIAERGGLLRLPAHLHVSAEQAMELSPEQVLIVASGTQGEPTSALARIAQKRHRVVALEPGDLVIHSARNIPGNEKSIARMINQLLRSGAEVVTAADRPVHVSGHGSRSELQRLIELVRPRFLVPIHGEYRQLDAHARLAVDMGMEASAVQLADSGDVIGLTREEIAVDERVHVGQVLLDADRRVVDRETLRERRKLATGGVVVPVVALNRETGALNATPEIVSCGVAATLDQARAVVAASLAEATPEEQADHGLLRAKVQTELRRFLKRSIERPPLVLPTVVELS
jgi:ribonuclease J